MLGWVLKRGLQTATGAPEAFPGESPTPTYTHRLHTERQQTDGTKKESDDTQIEQPDTPVQLLLPER